MQYEIENITVSKGEFDDRVELKWDRVEAAKLYAVYRKAPTGEYELLTRNLEEPGFVDYDVECGTEYKYALKYRDEGSWSESTYSDLGFAKEKEVERLTPGQRFRTWLVSVKGVFVSLGFLAVVYTLFFTNVEYVSESRMILKESNVQPAPASLLAIVNPAVNNQRQNVKVLETFLFSREMFEKVDAKFDLRGYFASSQVNFYDRLSKDDPIEDFLSLFSSKMSFIYDMENDIVNVSFYHTDSERAQKILEFVNREIIELINDLNKRTSAKKLDMINEVIRTSEREYRETKQELESFQSQYMTVSPKDDLIKRVELTVELEKQIEKLDNQIREKSTYMNEDYYEVKNLKTLKDDLEKKLDRRLKGLIGVDKNKVNLIINNFEELRGRLKLQQTIMAEALTKQTNMRIEIQKEKLILEIITEPTIGEDYARPVKTHNILVVIILGFMFYFIFNVVSTIVREKRY